MRSATHDNEMIAHVGSATPGDCVDGGSDVEFRMVVGMVVGGRERLETDTMFDNGPALPASSQALIMNEKIASES